MSHMILGKKLGMTRIFDRTGEAVTVTLIQAGPCTVLQLKDEKKDGYNALQLGFDEGKAKNTTKPLLGHFSATESAPCRFVREQRVDDLSGYQPGQVITAGIFTPGTYVDVSGTSKGKGYAGVMKRHGFGGFKASHGTHESFRGPGSVGSSADPARTFKGMKMAGRMGGEKVTVQNIKVVEVRESQNIIAVKGPVPGSRNGYLVIRSARKKPAPAPAPAQAPAEEA